MTHPAPTAVLAFDVGGTTVKAELVDDDLTVLARASGPTPRGSELVDGLATVGRSLVELLPEDTPRTVRAAGVVVPGIVDAGRGVSVYAANLGLRETPLAAPLAARLGVPVALGHDVRAAAAAERRRGAARGLDDPVVVVVGTGIAAVSYVHGHPVTGVSGQAGELGHVPVRPGGPPCGCGMRGCLESVASASAVSRAYAEATGRPVDGAHDVFARLGSDPVARRVWNDAAEALADGLLMVTALLAPGAFVLGGGLAEAGPALVDPVGAHMRRASAALTPPPVLTARLGSRAGVVGAALTALDTLGEAS